MTIFPFDRFSSSINQASFLQLTLFAVPGNLSSPIPNPCSLLLITVAPSSLRPDEECLAFDYLSKFIPTLQLV